MLGKAKYGIWPSLVPIGYLEVELPSGERGGITDPERAIWRSAASSFNATGDYSLRALVKWARQNGLTFRKSGNPIYRGTPTPFCITQSTVASSIGAANG
jgi:site-specific DNA recombinase